jgi:hypothetical protein
LEPSKLLANFSETLFLISKTCQIVGISWQDGTSYDQWDNICTTLYKEMVIFPASQLVQPDGELYIPIPEYGFTLEIYKNNYIFQIGKECEDSVLAFHSFVADNKNQFEDIRCIRLCKTSFRPLGELERKSFTDSFVSLVQLNG